MISEGDVKTDHRWPLSHAHMNATEPLHFCLSPKEDGEIGRRPSEELVSEAEPATDHSKIFSFTLVIFKYFHCSWGQFYCLILTIH